MTTLPTSVIHEAKEFARAFWYAMGNRNNTLEALRQFAILSGVFAYLLAVAWLASVIDR